MPPPAPRFMPLTAPPFRLSPAATTIPPSAASLRFSRGDAGRSALPASHSTSSDPSRHQTRNGQDVEFQDRDLEYQFRPATDQSGRAAARRRKTGRTLSSGD